MEAYRMIKLHGRGNDKKNILYIFFYSLFNDAVGNLGLFSFELLAYCK